MRGFGNKQQEHMYAVKSRVGRVSNPDRNFGQMMSYDEHGIVPNLLPEGFG